MLGVPLIEMQGISKGFPGVQALADVDFNLRPGEVHVLFGENGAGKSTLINIIAGTFPADTGGFLFLGRADAAPSPRTVPARWVSVRSSRSSRSSPR